MINKITPTTIMLWAFIECRPISRAIALGPNFLTDRFTTVCMTLRRFAFRTRARRTLFCHLRIVILVTRDVRRIQFLGSA
jgi:hypothetical protein